MVSTWKNQCDIEIWRTDLNSHRINARETAYIPSRFHKYMLKNSRENVVQQNLPCCPLMILVTLTFNLGP